MPISRPIIEPSATSRIVLKRVASAPDAGPLSRNEDRLRRSKHALQSQETRARGLRRLHLAMRPTGAQNLLY